MVFYSPLRYPGGKRKLVEYFKEVIEKNDLKGGTYVEPYAGGSSIALSLLIDRYVSKIIINDNDKSIYAFWHSILNYTDEFCKLINDTPINRKHWRKQKEIQENEKYDLLKLGFSTFYLNRTNYSGILRAGPIGGFKQKGNWKIDARYNKKGSIKKIKRIAKYRGKIEVLNLDAVKLIRKLKKNLPEKTLFYFDPPYFVKGKELYMNYYDEEAHNYVALEIFKINEQKWIVTYDNVPKIMEIYSKHNPKGYNIRYSAGNHHEGKEIMANSQNLLMPPLIKDQFQ